MLKIKEDKMQELEKIGFVENGYFSNFVYETTSKKGDGIIITVDAEAKRSLNELWDKGFLDKVGYNYRRTATWKFSNRWYTGEPKQFI